MQNLRALKPIQWIVALFSIVFITVLVPRAMAAAKPAIAKLSQYAAPAGTAVSLTITGANFVPGHTTVNWKGAVSRSLTPASYVGTTELKVTIPSTLLTTAGSATISVTTTPGGTSIESLKFTVEPVITGLSPAFAAPPAKENLSLIISGAGFATGSTVNWTMAGKKTTLTATYNSTKKSLSTVVTKSLLATAGIASVTVTTAGATSTVWDFAVEPGPTISANGLSPSSAFNGGPGFTLTITGANFIADAQTPVQVKWGSTLLTPIKVVNTGKITATVPATLLVNTGTALKHANVTVVAAGGTSAPAIFTIEPKLTISGLSPAFIAPGSKQGFTLTVNGSDFVNGDAVYWNGATKLTDVSVKSSTQLTASVASTLIQTAGIATITVETSTSIKSNAWNFAVEPKPAIAANGLTPSSAVAGNPAFALTITGTNFIGDARAPVQVEFGKTLLPSADVKVNSSGKITATVPATLLVNTGTAAVKVNITVSAAGGTSAPAIFTIEPVTPVITGLSPTSEPVGNQQFTLTVNGYDFAAGSQVFFNNVGLATTVKNATQLTATVPSNLIQTAGTVSVKVVSNKITSSPFPFTITSGVKPTITSLSRTSVTAGGPSFDLTVNGTGFVQGGTTLNWALTGGATTPLTQIGLNGSTQLNVIIPAALTANAGAVTVSVTTSAGTSNGVKFTIQQGLPTVTGLSPNSATAGQAAAQPLTITGTQFASVKSVNWVVGTTSTPLKPFTVNSPTQITTSIPASLLTAAGRVNIDVTTSAGTSNSLPFTINASGSGACAGNGSGNSKLSGVYSFQFTQVDPTNNGEVNYNVGTFTADGKGNITGGIQDSNGPYFTSAEVSANQDVSFTGTYSVGGDSRGLLTLNYTGGAVANVCIALDSFNAGVAGSGRLVSDAGNPQIDSGSFAAQGSSNIGASTAAGSWALGLEGIKLDPSNGDETRGATAGYVTLNGTTSSVTAGEADISQDQYSSGSLTNSSKAQAAITGSYTLAPTGRGALTLNYAGAGTSNYVFYVAGTGQIFLLSTDTGGQGGSAVMSGRALLRPASITFGDGTLKGNSVFIDQALTNTNSTQYGNRLVQAGIFSWSGSGSYTENYDQNDAGEVSSLQSASSTYSVDSVGRVTIKGTTPSAFGYLANSNQGFAVSGNLGVSSMYFESQATGGFNLASFSGDYSEGSVGYGFEQEKALSGEVDASGSGSLTGSIDLAPALTGCVDCASERGLGAETDWTRPRPRDVSLSQTYATSSVAGRFVVMNGAETVQALYLVSQDKAYAVDISGDAWQTLEVFNHQ